MKKHFLLQNDDVATHAAMPALALSVTTESRPDGTTANETILLEAMEHGYQSRHLFH